jgi:PBP1b-binding outer membrane lipoprotein LpoB
MSPARPNPRTGDLVRILAILAVALLLSGCASTRKVSRELMVMNEPGIFSLRIGSLENISHRRQYEWINAMGQATVRQASKVKSGVARIEVRDAAGIIVHSKSLSQKGSFVTAAGKPGVWRILLVLDHATGSVMFEVKH